MAHEVGTDVVADGSRGSRRLWLRSVLGLAAATMVVGGLAACGGEDGDDDEGEDDEDD